ncbi:MAG: 2,5-diamino-6-(ribosylamino)-4(3H)-pyrimidinone 5'-phosphate reductase [Candidatus Bathyarchaeota archaeon]
MTVQKEKPYVILSAAMTLDGKIATKTRDSEISSLEDWERVYRLRSEVDALMIGINTLLTDNPKITLKYPRKKPLIKVVVDSLAKTPKDAKILQNKDGSVVVIAVTENAPKDKVEELKKAGAEIIFAGSGRRVDLKHLLRSLWDMGVRSVMVEGGGTLNWSLVSEGLVDEVRVSVAPIIVGGKDSLTIVEGEGYNRVKDGLKLRLTNVEVINSDVVVLTYKRVIEE